MGNIVSFLFILKRNFVFWDLKMGNFVSFLFILERNFVRTLGLNQLRYMNFVKKSKSWQRIIMNISWVTTRLILIPFRRTESTFLNFWELISSPKTTLAWASKKCLEKSYFLTVYFAGENYIMATLFLRKINSC